MVTSSSWGQACEAEWSRLPSTWSLSGREGIGMLLILPPRPADLPLPWWIMEVHGAEVRLGRAVMRGNDATRGQTGDRVGQPSPGEAGKTRRPGHGRAAAGPTRQDRASRMAGPLRCPDRC